MIVAAAIAKGGVGKSTLIRALASVAATRGYEVVVLDADVRKNMARWVAMLEGTGRKPENLSLVEVNNPRQVVAEARKLDHDKAVVFIDTEGTSNDMLMAGLFVADIVVVPVFFSLDDVSAAIQLVESYIPVAVESRGRALPALYVLTKQTVIDSRARALKELREIIQENGTPVAPHFLQNRVAYRDLQSGSTLYNAPNKDVKAIAESEGVFDDVILTLTAAMQKAA